MGTRRTGIPSMIKYIRKVLQLINDFLGVILLLYPDDPDIQDLATSYSTAAQNLLSWLEEHRDYGD